MAEYPIIKNDPTLYNKLFHSFKDGIVSYNVLTSHKDNVLKARDISNDLNITNNSLTTKETILSSIDDTLNQNSTSFTTTSLTATTLNTKKVDDDIITLHKNNVSGTTTQSNKLNTANSSLTTNTKNVDDNEQKKTDLETSLSSSSTNVTTQSNNLSALETVFVGIINLIDVMRKGVNKIPGVNLSWEYDGGIDIS